LQLLQQPQALSATVAGGGTPTGAAATTVEDAAKQFAEIGYVKS
jgi:hypothetical protein